MNGYVVLFIVVVAAAAAAAVSVVVVVCCCCFGSFFRCCCCWLVVGWLLVCLFCWFVCLSFWVGLGVGRGRSRVAVEMNLYSFCFRLYTQSQQPCSETDPAYQRIWIRVSRRLPMTDLLTLYISTPPVFSSFRNTMAYHHLKPLAVLPFRRCGGHTSRGQNSCRGEITACCKTIRHSPLPLLRRVQGCQSWIHYSVSICRVDVFTTVIITDI